MTAPGDVTGAVEQTGPWLTDFLAGVIEPALTLATAVGLVWTVFVGTRRVWRRTWGSRRELRKKIDLLGIGLSEDYIEGLFGEPLLRVERDGKDVLTYLPKHAWVSISFGKERSVTAFSVTTVDPKFNYSTWLHTFGIIDIRLGISTFADAVTNYGMNGDLLMFGAHSFEAKQSVYLANPGAYLTVIFINTWTGVESRRNRAIGPEPTARPGDRLAWARWPNPGVWASGVFRGQAAHDEVGGKPDDDQAWLTGFRKGLVITGFTVTKSVNDDPSTQDQLVRTMRPADRQYRSLSQQFTHWRSRRRRATEQMPEGTPS